MTMLDPHIIPVADDELEKILVAALRASGGSMTRETSCYMASVVAAHLVDRLVLAGMRVVRVPDGLPLRD